jgi:hypothetical protein
MKKVLIILFFCFPSIALPCSCIGKSKLKIEIERSNIIFSGKILSKRIFSIKIEYVPEEFSPKKVEYTVLVTKKYKGKILSDSLRIVTGIGNGDCGYNFLIDHTYIIYGVYSEKYFEGGEKVNQFIETDICSRTRLYEGLEEKKIIKYLKKTPLALRRVLIKSCANVSTQS